MNHKPTQGGDAPSYARESGKMTLQTERLTMWLYGLHMSVCTGSFFHTCTGYWWAPVGCDDTLRDAWLDPWWTGWSHTRATWGPNPELTVPSDGLTMGLRSLMEPRTPPAHTGKSTSHWPTAKLVMLEKAGDNRTFCTHMWKEHLRATSSVLW